MTAVLLDTNILIALEDTNKPLGKSYAEALRNAPTDIEFYYHPIQIEDINRDRNEERKNLVLSRINRYKSLNQPPSFNDEYFRKKGWINRSENDLVDNTLLACVVEPVVDYLVTNDKGILSKARKANVEDRVLDIESFRDLISKKPEPPELAYVKDEQCHVLDVEDSFFDSLRKGYEEFDAWLEKCAREQRKCWTIRKDGKLAALCIYKREEASIIDDQGFQPDGPILKLCTFKVDSSIHGQKMGERLLHMAFSYAVQQDFNFVYLTVQEKEHPHLMMLMDSFGFKAYGKYGKDRVLGKYLRPQTASDEKLSKSEYADLFYPSFKDGNDVKKFLVPIQRQYHERLFPDISDLRYSLFGETPEMYGPESNTIRKAYLCDAAINKINPGDLLLFYRSQDRHSIEVLGVVKDVCRLNDRKEIYDVVKGRTVYPIYEIDRMVNKSKKGVLVLCFDLIEYFEKPISLNRLSEMDVTPPQSICELSDEKYISIMEARR